MPHKRKVLNIKGPNLWYLVGLITSDGCLSSDGRHIDITSNNCEYLNGIRRLIGVKNKIGVKYGIQAKKAFRIQIANRNFYDFLLSIGLKPAKSSTVGPIKVPSTYFNDFLRGVIDGDGSIRRWIHPSNEREQWSLRIYSGSEVFARWLFSKVESLIGCRGKIHKNSATVWVVKYGKMAAREIVKSCYYANAFALKRKNKLAYACIDSYQGWRTSKTVLTRI